MTRYDKLKVEKLINKALYQENAINKEKYYKVSKKIEKMIYEESKKNDNI